MKQLVILICVVCTLFLSACSTEPQICFDTTCFDIEVANTQETRMQGLMHRESMPRNHGMLFVFDEDGMYSFWMKNTLMSLDIIWLDANKNIVYINANTPPCITPSCPSYGPEEKSRYVLELNAGVAAQTELSVGDTATFELETHKYSS